MRLSPLNGGGAFYQRAPGSRRARQPCPPESPQAASGLFTGATLLTAHGARREALRDHQAPAAAAVAEAQLIAARQRACEEHRVLEGDLRAGNQGAVGLERLAQLLAA